MKKWTYHHIFGTLVCLAAGLSLVIWLMDLAGITLRTIPIWMEDWITICLFLGFTVAVIWRLVWQMKRKNRWWTQAAAVLLAVVLWLVGTWLALGVIAFSSTVQDSKVYTSPDGKHSICITRENFLATDWNNVYVITSAFTMRRVERIGSRMDFTYFSVIWHEDYAEIVCGEERLVIDFS
jgi:hypothetical protein